MLQVLTDGLLVCTILFLMLLFITEVASFLTYGKILPTEIVNKALDIHIPKGAELNPFDTNIITIGDMPYIATTKSFLAYYHIDDIGRVWIFSSAHKRISKLHNELLNNPETNPKPTIEQLLKIDK